MPSIALDPENTSLELEFVYGYHGSRCRDNLFYIETGEIVYHIAGVGIVYNSETNTQRFFTGHTDDIISLTLHPNNKYVATGQIGKDPYIAIWNAITMETVSILKDFHQRGICSLGFSNDGDYLVSVGLDDNHEMALWDWKSGRIVANAPTSKERIFDIQLSPYSNVVVTCGVKHIQFWNYTGNSLLPKRGIFGDVGSTQTLLCIFFGHEDGKTYTGTLNGEVYIWEGNKLAKCIKSHKGPLYTVTTFDGGFLTGGKDGVLRVWDKNFNPVVSIPLGKYNIRSIVAGSHGRVLVGTKTSEIIEIILDGTEKPKKKLLIEGHGEGELWGLGMHFSQNLFVSASDDKEVRIWDGNLHKCLLTIKTEHEARSSSFSPASNHIAVGFIDGSFAVYNSGDGSTIATHKPRKEEISAIAYSPDGKWLAVGSRDNFVDVYETGKYSKQGTCSGNTSFILHLDWSRDSKYIRTNSGSYEILYFSVPQFKHETKEPKVEWSTWTSVLGTSVAGIWPPYSDKTDVNTCDRSPCGNMLVTGDDFGGVKLFKFPVPKGAAFKRYIGHSAHVTNVKWSPDNSFVVSAGGGDQAILQWRVVRNNGGDPVAEDDGFDSDIEKEKTIDYTKKEKPNVSDEGDDLETIKLDSTGGLFEVTSASDIVRSGRPGLTKKAWTPSEGDNSSIPEPGKSISGHTESNNAPQRDLELEFVYGYRGFDTHNNLFYTKDGNLIYHNAAVGIVFNPKQNSQKQFVKHTDDIISLTLHPDGEIVATGQVGKVPQIIVWDSKTNQVLSTLKGFHERGVSYLNFSPDGSQLLSVGLDDKNSIALWEWRKGRKIASGPGSQTKVFAIKFNPFIPNNFVSVGEKHICFWQPAGNGLVSNKGIFGNTGKLQSLLDVAFDKNFTYTTTLSGEIYKWSERNLVEVIPAHKGPVFALCVTPNGFASGGKDGTIKLWDSKFKQIQVIKLEVKNEGIVGLKSLSANQQGRILVGTIDGDILEADSKSGSSQVLVVGHSLGELWGLATHPSKGQFATTSDDKQLKIWDIGTRKQVANITLPQPSRSVAYSPDGTQLAVGFKDGSFAVYDAIKLTQIILKKDRKENISEVKYSPNGQLLAVGSHDNFVDIYSTKGWNRTGRCTGSSSYITHIDWSADSGLLSTNSGAYEQLYFQAPKGERTNISAKAAKSVEWATFTGVLGDQVNGIWPKESDGTDINSTDLNHSRDVIATADDFGLVKLFQYPAKNRFSKFRMYLGHSAHVTKVRFTFNDSHLISIGGGDTSIFQWKYKAKEEPDEDDQVIEDAYDSDVEKEKKLQYVPKADLRDKFDATLNSKVEAVLEVDKTQQVPSGPFSVQKSTDVVHAARPSKFDEQILNHDNSKASSDIKNLNLEWVHGYRGHDCRNNLFYTASGDIIWHTAAAGIVYSAKNKGQSFYLEHTDDIVSIDYHKDQNVVATGQVGRIPEIHLWSPKSLKNLSILKGPNQRAVCAVSFSQSGNLLASIDESNEHTIVIWEWKKGIIIASNPCSKAKIFDVSFNPFNEHELATVGDKHITFWKVAGGKLEQKNGVFGTIGPQQTQLCVTYGPKNAYTGAVSGEIHVWTDGKLSKVVKGHAGPIYTIMGPDDKGEYLSAGKDNKIIKWTKEFAKKEEIPVPQESYSKKKASVLVKSIMDNHNGHLLIGTTTGEIYELNMATKSSTIIDQGHGHGELWGLGVHPSKLQFATAGDDKTLRIWDIPTRSMLAATKLAVQARSVDYSPDGKLLAVGFINGSFEVYNATDLQKIQGKRNRKEAVDDIKFSLNGKYLAVSSHDNFVDIYDLSTPDWPRTGICKGSSSYITHIDWTKDSQYLQTNSGAYEHLLFEAPSGKHVTQKKLVAKLNDIKEWSTWTGVLGKDIAGIWPPNSDKTDVNGLDVSKKRNTIATGDDFGFVKLFKYPCSNKGAEFKQYKGHSAHVTRVRFVHDDTYLISIGGGDNSIFVWRVT